MYTLYHKVLEPRNYLLEGVSTSCSVRIHVGTQSCPVFLLLKGGHNHGTYGVSGMYGYNVGM